MKNKMIVFLGLMALVFTIASGIPGNRTHDNLQVLPKDISNEDLDSVMSGFEKALNVGCDFCHSKSKTNPLDTDYASDDKPEKEITRIMMKMTEKINKEWFDYTILYKGREIMAVSCKTCHDGFPRPELKYEKLH